MRPNAAPWSGAPGFEIGAEAALAEEETSRHKVIEDVSGPYDQERAALGERDSPERAEHRRLNHCVDGGGRPPDEYDPNVHQPK